MRGIISGWRSNAGGLLVIAGLTGVLAPAALSAQSLLSAEPAGIRISRADSIDRPDVGQLTRLYAAATYGLAGAVTFGFIGYMIAGPCRYECDILSMNHVVVGAAIGEILGSTYGAARHRGRGRCTREQRVGMGLGGAFLGVLASTAVAQVPPGRIAILGVIPLGSIMFMKGC